MLKQCSKCKKELEIESNFNKNGVRNGKQEYRAECKPCYNKKQKEKRKIWKIELEEFLIGYFGELKCSKCGYNKYKEALDLHHIDSNTKEYGISDMRGYSWDKIISEVQKCILICSNCHRHIHHKEQN